MNEKQTQERLEQVMQKLRDRGYRLTPQRMAIVRAVMRSTSHPTADEIYHQVASEFPMLSLATVYKTMNMLSEIGEVLTMEVDGRSHYDGNVTPHSHLVCVKCHSIIDLPDDMARTAEEIIAEDTFGFRKYYIVIYGLCPDCVRQESN